MQIKTRFALDLLWLRRAPCYRGGQYCSRRSSLAVPPLAGSPNLPEEEKKGGLVDDAATCLRTADQCRGWQLGRAQRYEPAARRAQKDDLGEGLQEQQQQHHLPACLPVGRSVGLKQAQIRLADVFTMTSTSGVDYTMENLRTFARFIDLIQPNRSVWGYLLIELAYINEKKTFQNKSIISIYWNIPLGFRHIFHCKKMTIIAVQCVERLNFSVMWP